MDHEYGEQGVRSAVDPEPAGPQTPEPETSATANDADAWVAPTDAVETTTRSGSTPGDESDTLESLPPVDASANEFPQSEPAPSWAWSTDATSAHNAGTPGAMAVDPDQVDAGPVERQRSSRRSGLRSALVGGVAGALVGALIAGGLVVAFDDDPQPGQVTTVETTDDTARPASQPVESGDIRSILSAARPAVVRIDVGGSNSVTQGTGTGFIIDSSGVIVTNAHVVDGFDTVTVHTAAGDALEGDVIGEDASLDVAVVQVDQTGLPALELGDSDALQVGDPVIAIGNALGLSEGSGATVTTGIISGLDRVVEVGQQEVLFNAIQTDAAINPGNSGGPLVDANGRVIGINTAIASPDTSNNVGFAISISSATPVIQALREGREVQVAFLGVSSEPVTTQNSEELGVTQGAVVSEVTSGSAADEAGLEQGDVIVEVAGTKVDSVDDVASEVRKHSPGDVIDIVVVRDGDQQTLQATLGERPQDS